VRVPPRGLADKASPLLVSQSERCPGTLRALRVTARLQTLPADILHKIIALQRRRPNERYVGCTRGFFVASLGLRERRSPLHQRALSRE